jgi:peptide/nickel transport system ATP-binding protein/oligopeptide transport system ATP-binding protein
LSSDILVALENAKKYYPVTSGLFSKASAWVKAVDGVDLTIRRGETLGLVGESGCGKSTLGRLVLRLEDPTEGAIIFEGQDIARLPNKQMDKLRAEMQVIFQDPYSSLNFRRTVGQTVEEPFIVHRKHMNKKERRQEAARLIQEVGLRPEHISRYPHEFSGGQRQRIGIARALALNPKLIVCDEPVSALDVSIQAQIINLLQDLQEGHRLTYLFIAHDLSVVEHISNRVAVMYLGRIVETAANEKIYNNPLHPYTQALTSASPSPNPKKKKRRIILEGDVPSPINPPPGCNFHTRCPKAFEACDKAVPVLQEIEPGHWVSCFLHNR